MKIKAMGSQLVGIRVDLSRNRYAEIVVAKHGGNVMISMDGIYGEGEEDTRLQVEGLQVALNIAAVAKISDDWVAKVTSVVGG